MNKKGQALIEFILIMPIFLILIMSLIDVGNIYIKKYELNIEFTCEESSRKVIISDCLAHCTLRESKIIFVTMVIINTMKNDDSLFWLWMKCYRPASTHCL